MHSDWRKHLPAMLVFATYAGFGACGDAWAADRTGTSHNLTDQLGALEERSYAAWKSGDTTFWKSFLTDQFVAWGSAGRLDDGRACLARGRVPDRQLSPHGHPSHCTDGACGGAYASHRCERGLRWEDVGASVLHGDGVRA